MKTKVFSHTISVVVEIFCQKIVKLTGDITHLYIKRKFLSKTVFRILNLLIWSSFVFWILEQSIFV